MDLERQVLHTVRRHSMFTPGMRVGAAVSGGADSVCLLHALLRLPLNLRITVLHLNHRLRGAESDGDQAFVESLARDLGLPILVRQTDLAGGNLEQAARQARLAFFRESLAALPLDRVAVGHTRSDQAETVLFRFLRGSGTSGLSGIRPVTGWGMVRPLLEVDRPTVAAWLHTRGIGWREDSSNRHLNFARNRIRHQLLPQLQREWNPAMGATLASTAEWAQGEEKYWEAEIDRLSADALERCGNSVLLRSTVLSAFPTAVARRLVRRAMEIAKGDLRGIGLDHVDAVVLLAARANGSGRVLAPGVHIQRSFDWLRFSVPASAQTESYVYELTPPLPAQVHGIGLELIENSETSDISACVYNGGMGCLDWSALSGSLMLRNWQAGDRFQPMGSAGETRIKLLFQKARVPLWERRGWPVLVDGESIVWTRRFGSGARFAANAHSARVLMVRDAVGQNGIEPRRDGVYSGKAGTEVS
jgi:tRNA(Ile)-lysidine synthase